MLEGVLEHKTLRLLQLYGAGNPWFEGVLELNDMYHAVMCSLETPCLTGCPKADWSSDRTQPEYRRRGHVPRQSLHFAGNRRSRASRPFHRV